MAANMDSADPQPKAALIEMLPSDQFPRAAAYDLEWVLENQMGPNVLWLTESLTQVMALKPGMRVLDIGCGRAISSTFLASATILGLGVLYL